MARYRQSERRWVHAALVAGAYLVFIASLFTLQLGTGLNLPISVAVSAPPLVYAALAVLLLRQAPFVRRLSWVGGACVVHLVLGVLAATELAWAGGLSLPAALAQVFVLFPPAPVLTLVATPLTLAAFGLTPAKPAPRVESAPARPVTPPARPKPISPPARAAATPTAPTPRGVTSPGAMPAASAPRAVTSPGAAPAAPAVAPHGRPSMPAAPPAAVPAAPVSAPPVIAPKPVAPAAPAPVAPIAAPSPAAVPTPGTAPAPAALAANRAQKPARAADDGMVRVPFARIAAQLPAEAFVLPFERLSESLREPHVLLIPRRVVLSQMRDGGVAITWGHIASQFPDLALGMSDDEFRTRYPDLELSLTLEEVASQLPSGAVSAAAPAPQPEWATAPAVTPPLPAAPAPAPKSPTLSPPPRVSAPLRVELVAREELSRIVACFNGVGSFEAAAERLADSTTVTLVEPGLPRAAATTLAARLLPFMAGTSSDVVIVRTERAVLILAAAARPIVVAAHAGAPVALLCLRAVRAAAAETNGALNAPSAPPRALEPVIFDGRVARATRALRSFGSLEPTVFADGPARVYVFCGAGGDDKMLGALALDICDAAGDGADLGRLRAVVLRGGGEHTVVRPLAGAAGALAVSGPVTRPGRVLGDVDRAATALESI